MLPLPRIRRLAVLVVLVPVLSACLSYTPVSELAPPAGPDARVLAGDLNVQNILGIDEAALWPDAGEEAVLASCAVAFRTEEDVEVRSIRYLTDAVEVAESDVEQIVDTFCGTLTTQIYDRVPLQWMSEDEIADEILPRSENAGSQLAVAYEGYGYFGSLGGVAPTLSGGMRDMARELGMPVFVAGITLRLAEGGELRFAGTDLTLNGYVSDGKMINSADLMVSGGGRYILDNYGSEGLTVLAEALAMRFAHVIESQSGDWPEQ